MVLYKLTHPGVGQFIETPVLGQYEPWVYGF